MNLSPSRILAAFVLLLPGAMAQAAVLALNHEAASTIVVDRNASDQVRTAAQTLQKYIERSTGALLRISDQPAGAGVSINVGVTDYVRRHDPRPAGLDQDGFVLDGTDAGNFIIVGGSDWGTEFGVDEFLERYLDICWLMPTELGEDVPARATLEVPDTRVVQEPVYLSRQFSPLDVDDSGINMANRNVDPFYMGKDSPNFVNDQWARFNRARGRVAFHHNLVELFAPNVFAIAHPEFYPVLNGKRDVPAPLATYVVPNWQPNFSAPGIVEAAAGRIDDYFAAHPGMASYSLGMNDDNGWDQSAASLARRDGKKNYLGLENISDDYFKWADDVAEQVLKKYPDKWFGTLAYEGLSDPPTRVSVNSHIVPFLTYERMRWGDPKLRDSGHDLTERWAKASPTLGWYDYAYGGQYLVPRVWFHRMQEDLAWGAAHHVKFYYAELYPNWGEGPKNWLYAKLLWNPNQDVDKLLDVWYRHAAGPAAAPKLREFYAIWERFWSSDLLHLHWNTDAGLYLRFTDANYLLEVPETYIERSDELMREAVALADTPQRKARVAKLAQMWDFYRASWTAYRAQSDLTAAGTKTESDVLTLLSRAAPAIQVSHYRQELLEGFADEPFYGLMANVLIYRYRYPLLGARWGVPSLWRAEPWIAQSPAVKSRLEDLARDSDSEVSQSARLVLDAASGKAASVVANPSLADGAAHWDHTHLEGLAGNGSPGLLITGIKGGAISQTVDYIPGDYYAVVECRVPHVLRSGTATVEITALNAAGGLERGSDGRKFYLPHADIPLLPGETNTLAMPFRVTPSDGPEVRLRMTITFAGLDPADEIHLVQAALYKEPQ